MTNRFEISGYSDVGDYMMVTVLIFGDSTFMSATFFDHLHLKSVTNTSKLSPTQTVTNIVTNIDLAEILPING